MNIPEHEHIDPEQRAVDLRLRAADVVDLISVVEYAHIRARHDVADAQEAIYDVEERREAAVRCGGTETARNRIYRAFDVELEEAERKLKEAQRMAETTSLVLGKVTSAGVQS